MRLKSIKLAGFKSFVDPTTVMFPNNLTAVVGPNGCGKSNIIDAVRWVMGESSAKHLRGESMADVIFNGASSRKPVAQASIELIFDNSLGKVGGEYARYTEICVRRQVTRDGQSHYFLNGTRCRRKDITDLFLGTGLGSRSYAIIEQGMITHLIGAKPEELRVYIEEAAGISRYKERRRETENRMRRTRANMDRLTDIRDELSRQLDRLSRQAAAAEKYKKLKQEEHQKNAELRALRWSVLQQQLQNAERQLKEQEVAVEARVASLRELDAAIEKVRDEQACAQEQLHEAQQGFYAEGAEVARLEQEIRHQTAQQQRLTDELQQVRQTLAETSGHLADDQVQTARLEERLEELAPALEVARALESETQDVLQTAEDGMQAWQRDWDAFNQTAAESRRQAEVEQSRIQHLERSIERLSDRLERLGKEQESLDTGTLGEEMSTLSERAALLQEQQDSTMERVAQLQDDIQNLRQTNGERGRQLEQEQQRLQQLCSRQASLEALQKAALGDDGSLTEWLLQHGLAETPRLSDSLEVTPGWEMAAEIVLGEALQGICVQGIDQVEAWLGDLAQGRLFFFQQRASESARKGAGLPLLSDLVRGPVVPALLEGVYAVETLAEALSRRTTLADYESLVTRDGIWLGRDWLRVVRDQDAEAGVLARRRLLADLEEEIAVCEGRIGDLRAAREEDRERVTDLDAEREQAQRQAREHARELAEARARISAHEVRLEQVTMRAERLGKELQESREQRDQEQTQVREARTLLATALDAMEADNSQREALLSRRDGCRNLVDESRQKARQARDQAHQLAMEVQQARTQLESLAHNVKRMEQQAAALQLREQELQSQLTPDERPLIALQQQLEEKLGDRLAAEQALQSARQKQEAVDHALRELDGQRHQAEQAVQEVRSVMDQQRMQWQEVRVRCRTLEEQFDEQGLDPAHLLAELSEDASESAWCEALDVIQQRIARLGQINLAAIDEYQVQSERKEYLDRQNTDLEDALRTLENAIRRIDRETRARFKEYFDRINQGLQHFFPKIFGGGEACLVLTSEDLLDTGVAITARPPGKKNSTIHLLSGGEKALTALALVFSIFQLNPAPFCMLDEVDAPLDDANAENYCHLVREMSSMVQFIYITHNKISMEMADTLLGITMHEPGVSRLVSVDVDEAAELAGG